MIRKCAIFAIGVALLVAFGIAVAHGLPMKRAAADGTPSCEPASRTFNAAWESKAAVSTFGSAFIPDKGERHAATVRRSAAQAIALAIPAPAISAFAPLFRRPPPNHL